MEYTVYLPQVTSWMNILCIFTAFIYRLQKYTSYSIKIYMGGMDEIALFYTSYIWRQSNILYIFVALIIQVVY